MKKILKWGLIIFIGMIVLGALVGDDTETSNNTTSEESESTEIVQAEQNKTFNAGEDVVVGEVRWKLVEAVDRGSVLRASDSKYASIAKNKKANGEGRFIQTTIEVENLGKEMKSVSSVKLVDDQGREFTSSSEASEWIPDGKELYIVSNLNPNVSKEFVEIYEVPSDAQGFKLVVGDLDLFGEKDSHINLGL